MSAPLGEWVREAMTWPRHVRPYTVLDGSYSARAGGWWSFDYGYHGVSLVPWGEGWRAEVFVHGDGVPLARCATPAELRAALDKMVAEVKP